MNIKSYWPDWLIKSCIFACVFLFFLFFILTGYTFAVLNIEGIESSFVVLHSSIYFGVDRIADAWQLFILPAIGLGFFILNFFIADRLWKISHFYTRLILISTTFIEVFILLGCLSLLKWNI